MAQSLGRAELPVLGLMAGLLLLDFLVRLWTPASSGPRILTMLSSIRAGGSRSTTGASSTPRAAPSTVASATALGRRGKVRLLEPPHTEENYLLKEMGFHIARKHRMRLRLIARLAGFAVPASLSLLAPAPRRRWPATLSAAMAVLSAALGLVVERWLFFAEAKHTVTLYYGADAV